MIDLELESIQPINIKTMEFNRYRIDENIRKSIILYNKAVSEIKTKEFDLAIEDLRKALSFNKSFAEAIKLLGLCYIRVNEFKKAKKTFKKLLEYEFYNEFAEKYFKFASYQKKATGKFNVRVKVKNKRTTNNKNFAVKVIIGFLIVAVLANLVYLQILKLQIESNKVESIKEFTIKDKADIYFENNNVPMIAIEKKKDIEYKIKYDDMLNEAEKANVSKKYESAAAILIKLRTENLDNDEKIRFDKLWKDIKGDGVFTIYRKACEFYNAGKYTEALPLVKMTFDIEPNFDQMPWVTYQIGVCYKEINDNINALAYFQKIKDEYPKSRYVSSAERMITAINK